MLSDCEASLFSSVSDYSDPSHSLRMTAQKKRRGTAAAFDIPHGVKTLPCSAEPKLAGLIGVLLPVSVSRMQRRLSLGVRAV